MHTLIVIVIGLALLGACSLAGHLMGGAEGLHKALLVFLPLWFIGASINMYIGVKHAGYSVADEAPILLIVFAVPAAVALGLWWRLR